MTKWIPPSKEAKLKLDGFSKENLGEVVMGDIMKDDQGKLVE
jgi:hypothetical protein